MPLEELKTHLEQALDAVVEAHIAQGLLIDKFIGDAVMSFRGGNLVEGTPEDHAYRVVRGALDGAKALADLGDPWFSAIKVGGASASDILIGTFGTSKRLSYTVLGDRVNLAARLEASCNGLGVTNLFCDQTRALVGDASDIVWRRIGSVRVQGKTESVVAFEAFDHEAAPAWLPAFHEALDQWEQGDVALAARGFEAVHEAHGDALSALYALACDALADGLPEGWEPVLVTRK
jgi:adenylate cyclase